MADSVGEGHPGAEMKEGNSQALSQHREADSSSFRHQSHPKSRSETQQDQNYTSTSRARKPMDDTLLHRADMQDSSLISKHPGSISPGAQDTEAPDSRIRTSDDPVSLRMEEEDDMALDDTAEMDDDQVSKLQTPAERTAARRKMKRFRYVQMQCTEEHLD